MFQVDGYCLKQHSILDIRRNRDRKSLRRIYSTNTALSDLLPSQRTRQLRTRSHNYIPPKVRTSRFKSVFNYRVFLIVTLLLLLTTKAATSCFQNIKTLIA